MKWVLVLMLVPSTWGQPIHSVYFHDEESCRGAALKIVELWEQKNGVRAKGWGPEKYTWDCFPTMTPKDHDH